MLQVLGSSLGPFFFAKRIQRTTGGLTRALVCGILAPMDLTSHPNQVTEVADKVCLSLQDDIFALAVVEYGGNLAAAYRAAFGEEVPMAAAKAREMMSRPEIAARVKELQESVREADLISMESHLIELANIRDLAKMMGAVKVALNAEEARGKVAGFYAGKGEAPPPPPAQPRLEMLAERLMGLMKPSRQGEVVDVPVHEVRAV